MEKFFVFENINGCKVAIKASSVVQVHESKDEKGSIECIDIVGLEECLHASFEVSAEKYSVESIVKSLEELKEADNKVCQQSEKEQEAKLKLSSDGYLRVEHSDSATDPCECRKVSSETSKRAYVMETSLRSLSNMLNLSSKGVVTLLDELQEAGLIIYRRSTNYSEPAIVGITEKTLEICSLDSQTPDTEHLRSLLLNRDYAFRLLFSIKWNSLHRLE